MTVPFTDGREDRSDQYQQGYRAACKDAVTWLHERAEEMDDAKAQGLLNGAAFHLGNDQKEPGYHNRMAARQRQRAKVLGLWPHQPHD